jgi:hypothetical protein
VGRFVGRWRHIYRRFEQRFSGLAHAGHPLFIIKASAAGRSAVIPRTFSSGTVILAEGLMASGEYRERHASKQPFSWGWLQAAPNGVDGAAASSHGRPIIGAVVDIEHQAAQSSKHGQNRTLNSLRLQDRGATAEVAPYARQ